MVLVMTEALPIIDTAFLASAAAADLEDWGPLDEATSAEIPMTTRGRTIWSAPDSSGAEVGIWECTAGPSYWVQEENEAIYVLSRFADRHAGRRPADHARPRRRRRIPAGLARPLGTARHRAQGLRAV
jgi:hypothetical protein